MHLCESVGFLVMTAALNFGTRILTQLFISLLPKHSFERRGLHNSTCNLQWLIKVAEGGKISNNLQLF